jgi:hypothetical protein
MNEKITTIITEFLLKAGIPVAAPQDDTPEGMINHNPIIQIFNYGETTKVALLTEFASMLFEFETDQFIDTILDNPLKQFLTDYKNNL